MIVAFLGIFIILLSVAYTMFVALLGIIIIKTKNVENAQLTPQKYAHLRLHLRKCSCFSRHDRLCRTCVLTGRRIQASRTGRTKHLGSVNGSSRVSKTKVFDSLSAAEADQKRPT